jgi:hypothetical protein
MTQPKQSAVEPDQQTVKEHVKALLRKIPLKSQGNGQAHQYQASAEYQLGVKA